VLRPDGIGDLVVGRPVPVSDPTGALVSWNPTACSEVGLKPGEPYAGLWQTTYPQDPSGPLQPDPFRIGVSGGLQDGDITGVEVYSPHILTERGIHLLSTAADVEAAYPGASKKVFPQSEVYSIAAGPARLDIEVLPPDGSDQGGRVIIMTASASDQDVAALYASDAGYGNCPV
jgi:hypothetical protein